MDIIEKKILSMLEKDVRIPSSEIAKKLKTSRQVVDYRMNKLVEENIILNFTFLIDASKFHHHMWHIYLKLQNLTGQSEKNIITFLNNKKEVWWIASCQGEWDLIFSVIGDDLLIFDKLITDFKSQFHMYINQQYITSLIKVWMFPRGYFLNKPTKKEIFLSGATPIKIGEKDKSILKIVATQARMPATEIAKQTKTSARQVIYRMKELIKKHIIAGSRLHLNFNQLQYDYYKVCFYTQDFTEEKEKSLLSWCEMNPNTLYYVKKIAPWTFEIEFETESYKQLNEILKELRNKFGNVIKRTETSLITEELKGEMNFL